MRQFVAIGIVALFTVVSCSDESGPPEDDIPCDSDEDCLEGQVCSDDAGGAAESACIDDNDSSRCKDGDGDGYGRGEGTQECEACVKNQPRGCEEDCDDDNPDVFPGHVEFCNNRDDNCNPEDDDPETPIGRTSCAADEGCPLEGVVEEPQENTRWGCAEIDGEPQCVLEGFAPADGDCDLPENLGTCHDGEWTEVPAECRGE